MNGFTFPTIQLETALQEDEVKKHLDNFFHEMIENYNVLNCNYDTGIVETREGELYYFESSYSLILQKSLEMAKSSINTLALHNVTNLGQYTVQLQTALEDLLEIPSIKRFPKFSKFIFDIASHFNKYVSTEDQKIFLNPTIIEDSENHNLSEEQIIESIIGYLKGENHTKTKILNEEDYQELKNNFIEFAREPRNITPRFKISVNKTISKPLLLFTFWVLHKYLFTTNKILPEFLDLLKNSFSDFDNHADSTIKSKFGSKDKVTYKGRKYIPTIIKNELEK